MLVLALTDSSHPLSFFAPMALFVIGFSFLYPLSTAKALNPFKEIAGTASSLLGFTQNIMGAAVSALLAVFIDGTALPISLAVALCGIASAGIYILYQGNKQPTE